MKTLKPLCLLTLSASILLALQSHVSALNERTPSKINLEIPQLPGVMSFQEVDGVFVQGGALFRLDKGVKQPVSGPIRFGSEYEVRSDGQVIQSTSALWRLVEGQMLFQDGSIMLEDGSMTYVGDHYVQQAGKLVKVSQGKRTTVTAGHQLPNGIILKDYGRMIMPNGHVSILQDGQVLRADGVELPAWDTIQFQNGSVTLFKDGSMLSLARGRLMIMNDGTKVWGDGTISRRTPQSNWDEVKFQLPEGAVVRVPRIAGATNERRARRGY